MADIHGDFSSRAFTVNIHSAHSQKHSQRVFTENIHSANLTGNRLGASEYASLASVGRCMCILAQERRKAAGSGELTLGSIVSFLTEKSDQRQEQRTMLRTVNNKHRCGDKGSESESKSECDCHWGDASTSEKGEANTGERGCERHRKGKKTLCQEQACE
eukprot:513170-Pleurochrysis_carterae.AAC.1